MEPQWRPARERISRPDRACVRHTGDEGVCALERPQEGSVLAHVASGTPVARQWWQRGKHLALGPVECACRQHDGKCRPTCGTARGARSKRMGSRLPSAGSSPRQREQRPHDAVVESRKAWCRGVHARGCKTAGDGWWTGRLGRRCAVARSCGRRGVGGAAKQGYGAAGRLYSRFWRRTVAGAGRSIAAADATTVYARWAGEGTARTVR